MIVLQLVTNPALHAVGLGRMSAFHATLACFSYRTLKMAVCALVIANPLAFFTIRSIISAWDATQHAKNALDPKTKTALDVPKGSFRSTPILATLNASLKTPISSIKPDACVRKLNGLTSL